MESLTAFTKMFSKPASVMLRRLMALAGILSAVSFAADAPSFTPGAHVTLSRAATLYFRSQEFRQAPVGDTFVIAAPNNDGKSIYVYGLDKDGKEIGLSVDKSALVQVPVALSKLEQEALAAAQASQFTQAARVVHQVLLADPTNQWAFANWRATQATDLASAKWRAALDEQKKQNEEVARLQKEAAEARRPNPANPQDRSGWNQAMQLQAQARDLGKSSHAAVADSGREYAAAGQALLDSLQHTTDANAPADQPSPIAIEIAARAAGEATPPTRMSAEMASFFKTVSMALFRNGVPIRSTASNETVEPFTKSDEQVVKDAALLLQKRGEIAAQQAKYSADLQKNFDAAQKRMPEAAEGLKAEIFGQALNGLLNGDQAVDMGGMVKRTEEMSGGMDTQNKMLAKAQADLDGERMTNQVIDKLRSIAEDTAAKALAQQTMLKVSLATGKTNDGRMMVTNLSHVALHNCILIARLTPDEKRVKSKWMTQNMVGMLGMAFVGAGQDYQAIAAEQAKVMEASSLERRQIMVFLQRFDPGETVKLPVARVAGLMELAGDVDASLWSDEVSIPDQKPDNMDEVLNPQSPPRPAPNAASASAQSSLAGKSANGAQTGLGTSTGLGAPTGSGAQRAPAFGASGLDTSGALGATTRPGARPGRVTPTPTPWVNPLDMPARRGF